MVELGLLNNTTASTDARDYAQMLHNDSHKFESAFVTLTIPQNDSVMFGSLSGEKIGCWVAHGEGKFSLPLAEQEYNVVVSTTTPNILQTLTAPTIMSQPLQARTADILQSCHTRSAHSSHGSAATILKTAA